MIDELIDSTIIPERLDGFINKFAEHTHDKWAFEKVRDQPLPLLLPLPLPLPDESSLIVS